MAKKVYDPVPGTAQVPDVSLDAYTRARMALAAHTLVRGGVWWPDALVAVSRQFYTRWFYPGVN